MSNFFNICTYLWPFQIQPEIKTKVQILNKMLIFPQKIWNAPLDALMCAL